MIKQTLFPLLICLFFSSASAQVKTSVKNLAFMAGTWVQKHQWGDMEEYWGQPMGENMICSFRCVKDGKPMFYEFIVIEPVNGVPVMKMRHFNYGNIAWEEKNKPYVMRLNSVSKNYAVFIADGKKVKISYRLLSPTHLVSELLEIGKDGKWKKDVFDYSLKK